MLQLITNSNTNSQNYWKIKLETVESLDQSSQKELLKTLKFTAKFGEILILPESQSILVGASFEANQKTADPYYKINLYNLGAKVANKLKTLTVENFVLQEADIFRHNLTHSLGGFSKNLFDFVLGLAQASWALDLYLPEKKAKSKTINLSFDSKLLDLINSDFEIVFEALNSGITLTRSLVDDIPEVVNPETLPKIADRELAGYENITINHFNYDQIQEMGMNGITFVGRASRYTPSMIQAIIKPKGEVKHKICLVGKGVTYDSGGLDIKTNGIMRNMKTDMAGSATMFGVVRSLAQIGLENTEIQWISAWVENMVDGSSYKSDDILTTYSGQTVEVWNTDAEGRLTLADTLAFATLQNPDYIIDTATLTGAAVMATTEYYTAMMGNDADLINQLETVFIQESEKTISIPLPEILRSKVRGDLGELINTSNLSRQGGHITAALFLSHFIDQRNFRNPKLSIDQPKTYSWVHLDIAGSAWNKNNNDLEISGATGQSVRSLVSWVLSLDKTK